MFDPIAKFHPDPREEPLHVDDSETIVLWTIVLYSEDESRLLPLKPLMFRVSG
jgi:hypothetical protein